VYVMSMCVCDGWVWVWWECVCVMGEYIKECVRVYVMDGSRSDGSVCVMGEYRSDGSVCVMSDCVCDGWVFLFEKEIWLLTMVLLPELGFATAATKAL